MQSEFLLYPVNFSFFYSPTFTNCTNKTIVYVLFSMAWVRRLIPVFPLLSPQMEFWKWRRRKERFLVTNISLAHFVFFFFENVFFIQREVTDKHNEDGRYRLCARRLVKPLISVQEAQERLGKMLNKTRGAGKKEISWLVYHWGGVCIH